jgi:sialate O-acetylesterase
MKHCRLLLALGLALPIAAGASVTLAPLFRDDAVLQRDKPIPVWGLASPGEHVSVSFRDRQASAEADRDGRWTVSLDPLPASSSPADLVVTGDNKLVVHGVLVGEVWLCSGQSNMEFTVYDPANRSFQVANAQKEIADANFPLIRQFKVGKLESDTPVDTAAGSWVSCSPATVANFTAVGYFFARDIHRKLGVPVGIVECAWGGSAIEAWLSRVTLASNPAFRSVQARWIREQADYPLNKARRDALIQAWRTAESQSHQQGPDAHALFISQFPMPKPVDAPDKPYPHAPSRLYNGMLHPLIPYALRGVLWYQGESNTGRPWEYHRLFAAMIASWRGDFRQGDIPFYWVQLANYNGGNAAATNWAFLREAQARTLDLPATGMAVAIDIGSAEDIHPKNKQEVGRRLALIAKAKDYGITDDFSGPVFESAVRSGTGLLVSFRYSGTGLTAAGKPLQSFELAGPDRSFHPATAEIVRDQVLVHSAGVPNPVAVRYAWKNAPDANLYNGAGLPAAPFRSDSWPDPAQTSLP